MRYEYVVSLKRTGSRQTDAVGFLLCLFSFFSFLYVQLRSGNYRYFLGLAALIQFAGIILQMIRFRKGRELRFKNWLLAAGVCWIGMPYLQWLLFPFFVFGFLESQAKHPLEIGFSEEGIVLNRLFPKKIKWSSLESVILKDGMLTMDYKDNHLSQQEVLDDDDPDADEDEFNEYCRRKIVNLRQ
jgi:hypothetical protein